MPAVARALLLGLGGFGAIDRPLARREPAEGATPSVYVKEFTGDSISTAIKGPDGRPVANLTAAGTPAFNRLTRDLKHGSNVLTP